MSFKGCFISFHIRITTQVYWPIPFIYFKNKDTNNNILFL